MGRWMDVGERYRLLSPPDWTAVAGGGRCWEFSRKGKVAHPAGVVASRLLASSAFPTSAPSLLKCLLLMSALGTRLRDEVAFTTGARFPS